MKKILFLLPLFLIPISGFGQIFKFVFNGAASCPTPDNVAVIQNPTITVTPISRQNVSCKATAYSFNSNGWPTSNIQNENNYIEVTVVAKTGYQLNISSFSFETSKSSLGPSLGKVAIDKGSGSFTQSFDFTPSETSQIVEWTIGEFSVSSGSKVRLRIYGWKASDGTGTLRLNNVTLDGSVTQLGGGTGSGPFTVAQGNVGLDKIPTQKLDINGNIRTSGKLMVGDINDPTINTMTDVSLAVNGGALFTSATVKLNSNWPDYVFTQNYDLKSLEEVEKYIQEKGHLPNIPSAKEVTDSGIDLGAMDANLLKKIEELTLYSIEQNKMIKRQSEHIQKMEQVIEKILLKQD